MTNWLIFVSALIAVESGGNPRAIGDGGDSWGCLQIQAAVIEEVNRVYGTDYVHADAFEPTKARAICVRYLRHYATARRLGRPVTWEDRARCWNGGPNGWRKEATVKYWLKVEREINRRRH